jgi:putative YphP/YqiW family bacilliredoxin
MLGNMMVAPMRQALTRIGAVELRTAADVDRFLNDNRDTLAVVAINSTCGCAGGSMRPGLAMAVESAGQPDAFATVFAGQDHEATARLRQHITEYPPSSPAVVMFRGGEVVFMLERHQIQGRQPAEVAEDIAAALTSDG